MSKENLIPVMRGYKGTNKDMQCNPDGKVFQFELDKVYEHQGELELCKSGFHFCIHPSGIWSSYCDPEARMFEVEAYDVLDQREGEGVDVKMVARKIKFVREIKIDGHRNMGYRNTGYRNTGYRNTGDRNTGDRNTGDRNTGDGNTGDGNTGYRNTGYGNTGDGNTGDGNTGDRNTGYRNTGDGNTGDGNTGHWNAVNYSTGFFCLEESKAISFDLPTEISRQDFLNRPDVTYLGDVLMQDEPIDWEKVKTVPNITIEKLNELHTRFVQARKGTL